MDDVVSEPTPVGLERLAELAGAGDAPVSLSPYSETRCLVVNATGHLPEGDAARVTDWLARLVCPSVAVADDDADPAVTARCDVVVPDNQSTQPVAEAVARNPVAATVLVQVLRTSEGLPLESSLLVESLAYAGLQGGEEYARWLDDRPGESTADSGEEGPAVLMHRNARRLDVELNRPGHRNAMSVEMRDALMEVLSLVKADDSIKRVELSGRGRCFSVGGDLTEFGTAPDPASGHVIRGLALPGRLLADCADRVHVHVHGACIGSGVEFPAFAGHVSTAPNAHFQLPEVGMGLIPGAGGTTSIARRIGRQRLAWWALTGRRIRAERAREWGLVDAIEE